MKQRTVETMIGPILFIIYNNERSEKDGQDLLDDTIEVKNGSRKGFIKN